MDVDEFQSQIIYTTSSKYPRVNGTISRSSTSKLLVQQQHFSDNNNNPSEDHDRDRDIENSRPPNTNMVDPNNNSNNNHHLVDSMFRGWQNSSRIFRVSRASGGKDRHSKVLTSKGLRDRRVRLSVSTAIQFYDLQDRLGYDQPSKAVDWLINAAADSIAELPSLHVPFVDSPPRGIEIDDPKLGFGDFQQIDSSNNNNNSQNNNLSKSASSTSETSKGSGGLSLTRVNQRAKARERARERAKEKESENEQVVNDGQRRRGGARTANPMTSSSFTELLTTGGNNNNNQSGSSPSNHHSVAAPMMDYFTSNSLRPGLFLGQTQMGMNTINMQSTTFHLTGSAGEHQFSFGGGQESLIPSGNEYDLNFSMASNNNRGTLQSNSPSSASLLHHHNNLQRYGASMEGANNVPFFMSTSASSSSMETSHHHHHQHHSHFSSGLDGGLHLYYGDGGHHSDRKNNKPKH